MSDLRWLAGLKLIPPEQQKTQLPGIILAKKIKANTRQGHKMYMRIFKLEIKNLCIQVLAAKMM